MELQQLLNAVSTSSVIRLEVDLATLSSDGLVCPPTYAPARRGDPPYLPFRKAHVDGQVRDIVVLDSPQSQSNRIETAILEARRADRIPYPDIEIRFADLPDEPVYSVLQLSHRIYDAVMRAARLEGQPFYRTDIGQALQSCRLSDASALFTHAPITLVLGAWDSNGGGGPLAARIPRLLTSEIIGLDALPASVSATKFDLMDVRSNVAELLPSSDPVERFTIQTSSTKTKGAGKGSKPSEFGFGSIPATAMPRAAAISGARQTSVLSCAGLRQIRFGTGHDAAAAARDQAGRAVLAALALYGLLAQNATGYRLRSRCELLPVAGARLQRIGRTLQDVDTLDLEADAARQLLDAALAHAGQHGLTFRPRTLELLADDRLTELVRRSRRAAAESVGDMPAQEE